jgi:hypothetical protein
MHYNVFSVIEISSKESQITSGFPSSETINFHFHQIIDIYFNSNFNKPMELQFKYFLRMELIIK